jgi:hypothetical protein
MVLPAWNVVTPTLTVTASGGAVTAVTAGAEKGLGFDPYGTTVPLKFSGSCTAAAAANVNRDGSIGTISVTQGGVGCSGTTTASVNVDGTWDTAAPVNLIAGQNMTLFGGNLQKGNGGYTVWNAAGSRSSGTLLGGGGGTLPGGGSYTGLVANSSLGSATQVDQFPGTDFGAKLQACLGSVSTTYGGTCDARNFTGNLSMASNLTVSEANVTVLLPCATISTAAQVIVTAGTRNVTLRGCALRGASTASGSQGGTVFLYSGTGAMVQVGDPTYATDTMGFHLDNVVINTTASSSATAQGLTAYRTQEMDLESLYFLGNQNQTGMTLDGTGNYTGGTFFDDAFNGFQTAVNAIGHQASNAATTDWMNASAFVRLHIDCPTSAGNPISGTYGINLQQGDGNTFTGGDVESCATALHLGANAQNNTIVGLRNENSTNQVVADAGSSYNNWMTGGTMFTGQLTDNGTRNSFMDTFHRSFNGINGDWYGSQQDATVTNHYRIGIGAGNERGLLDRYQTDYGYRWTTGLSDATAGEQFFQILDELNNVNRLSIGQYNKGQSSTNNQTVINAAGTGAVVLNGSNNSGTGGVIIGSGGASESTVATINNAGNAQFNGTLQVGGASTFSGSTTVKNQADAEIDQFLWAGTSASQKESYTYKDWNGSSQWYMVKDANNNWALNSATGGLDSFKAYQSGNSGDTYINTSNSSGVIRLNYESGSSGRTYIYGGTSSSLIAAFSGTTAIAFPGLAASSGHNCLQIDNSGYVSNTGSACGSGSSGTNGTVSSGNAGQIAYYSANGTSLSGVSAVPVTAGGTGATTQAGALAALGAQAAIPGVAADGKTTPGIQVSGNVGASALIPAKTPYADIRAYGAYCDNVHDDTAALQAAINGLGTSGGVIETFGTCFFSNPTTLTWPNQSSHLIDEIKIQGTWEVATTFILPDFVDLVGDGGGSPSQFQGIGSTAGFGSSGTTGTLGTATAAGTATFTPSSMNYLYPGTAITVAGTTTCTISSVTLASNVCTATLSASCRIPPGAAITASGITGGTCNTSGHTVAGSSDYGNKTVSWMQAGANATSSGGTLTGLNEATTETVTIASTTTTTATATFAFPHLASDLFGVVALATTPNSVGHKSITNLAVRNCGGACIWSNGAFYVGLQNVSATTTQSITSIPLVLSTSSSVTIDQGVFINSPGYSSPFGIELTNNAASSGSGNGTGMILVSNSWIQGGVKMDAGGIPTSAVGGEIKFTRDTFEETSAAIRYDPTNVVGMGFIDLDDPMLQDNAGSLSQCFFYQTDYSYGNSGGGVFIRHLDNGQDACQVGGYFDQNLTVQGSAGDLPSNPTSSIGTFSDGRALEAELRGEGAGMSPQLIPYATANMPDVTTWGGGGGCNVTQGIAAPDGSATAVSIAGSSSFNPAAFTYTTNTGDYFIYGAWVRPGNSGGFVSSSGWKYPFNIFSSGLNDAFLDEPYPFTTASPHYFESSMAGDFWIPVVSIAQLKQGDGGSHTYYFNVPCPSVGSNQIWGAFVIHIPAGAVSANEVQRLRQQLLHGYVPPNMPGGQILAMHPSHKLYWGSDTNLYRGAAGVVKTDGAFNAVSGYQVNGTPLATGNMNDWTNTGISNGYVPAWNSTSGKWTPTALPSSVADTTFTTSTASVAANTCNATVQVAMSGVTASMTFAVTPTSDTSGATGWGSTGGLMLDVWPTAGYLNYKICNQTTAAISSPGAVTFNVSAR